MTLRRLTRLEYDNTLRDLVGDTSHPSRAFPEDDIGYGFDRIGDVLSVSPLHVEQYLAAAAHGVGEALREAVLPHVVTFEAEEVGAEVGAAWRDSHWNLWSNGELVVDATLPESGEYEVRVHAFGQQAGPEPVRMALLIDNAVVAEYDVLAVQGASGVYSHRFAGAPGEVRIAAAFLNDFYNPSDPDPSQRDRNLLLDKIELDGPYGAPPRDPARRALIMACEPRGPLDLECAQAIIERFASRAWRRPVEADEVERLLGLVRLAIEEGDDVRVGISLAAQAILVSPHFVFKLELDPEPNSLTPRALTGHELATRLSYFLWSTTPDAELLAAAEQGLLDEPEGLGVQVRRMMRDPRANALVDDFAEQWLFVRALDDHQPDYNYFPGYDDALRDAMKQETRLLVRHFLTQDRSLRDLIDADFTFVNERLARHYGLDLAGAEPVEGAPGFFRVDLRETERRGLLGHGGVLTVTSFPTRTSPVKRGKWVMEQLLCTPPPPPPAGVEAELVDDPGGLSQREQLALHRADPVCAACHVLMDPLGLGLEAFDGIGAFRTHTAPPGLGVEGFPVDASGEMPDGTQFTGLAELAEILKADAKIERCMTEKLFVYGLGRGPEFADVCHLEQIRGAAVADDLRPHALIGHLVQSPVFRARRGEAEPSPNDNHEEER